MKQYVFETSAERRLESYGTVLLSLVTIFKNHEKILPAKFEFSFPFHPSFQRLHSGWHAIPASCANAI